MPSPAVSRLSMPRLTSDSVRELLDRFLPHVGEDALVEAYCHSLEQLQYCPVLFTAADAHRLRSPSRSPPQPRFQSNALEIQLRLQQLYSITSSLGAHNLILLCFCCDAIAHLGECLGDFGGILSELHRIIFSSIFVRLELGGGEEEREDYILPYVLAEEMMQSKLRKMQKESKDMSRHRALIQSSREQNKLLLIRNIMRTQVNILKNCFCAWAKFVSDNKRQFDKISLVFARFWHKNDNMRWYFGQWVNIHNAQQSHNLGASIAREKALCSSAGLNVEATKQCIFQNDFAINSLANERRAIIKRIEIAISRSKDLKVAQTSLHSKHLSIKKRVLTWRAIGMSHARQLACTSSEPASPFAIELEKQLGDIDSFEVSKTILQVALSEMKTGGQNGHDPAGPVSTELAQLAVQRRMRGSGGAHGCGKVYRAALEMHIAEEKDLEDAGIKPVAQIFVIDLMQTMLRDAHRKLANVHNDSASSRVLDACFHRLSSQTERILKEDEIHAKGGAYRGISDFRATLQQATTLLSSSDASPSSSRTLFSMEDALDTAAWSCLNSVLAEDDLDFRRISAFGEMAQQILDELEGHITFKQRLKEILINAKQAVDQALRNYSYPLRHGLHDLAQDIGMPSTVVKETEDLGDARQWSDVERLVYFLLKSAVHASDEKHDPAGLQRYEDLVVEEVEAVISAAQARRCLSGKIPAGVKADLRSIFDRELNRNITARGFMGRHKWLALLEHAQLLDFRLTEDMAAKVFERHARDKRGLGFTQFTAALAVVAKRVNRSPFVSLRVKIDTVIQQIKH